VKHSRVSVALSLTIALGMRGRIGYAGGVGNHLRVKGYATVAVLNIRQSTTDTLNGGQRADGHWKGLIAPVKDVGVRKDIRDAIQARTGSINPTLRFTTLFRLMEQTEPTMY